MYYESDFKCGHYNLCKISLTSSPVDQMSSIMSFDFRKFLLVKCINGEKATYNTSVFSTKRERTWQILLEDSYSQYSREPHSKQASSLVEAMEGGVLANNRYLCQGRFT